MGRRFLKKHFLVVLLFLSLAIVEPDTSIELKRWNIHVVNGLGNGRLLFVHCKSRDDDLGEQNLYDGAEFSWTFRVNVIDTTLFWCFLRKPDAQSVSFDAFWVEKTSIWLFYRCYDANCIWTAKDDGVYLRDNPVQRDVLVHKWQ
ncbi:S-protein homolog 74-like [Momordica charantia]|uniref:S-protein homolog n=1 Tax=Momordica charantia TaxID=3673 RepID=A0A6J1CQH6_MOMCH|nr:S-protein homolog 74-like [Momordica charantia]